MTSHSTRRWYPHRNHGSWVPRNAPPPENA